MSKKLVNQPHWGYTHHKDDIRLNTVVEMPLFTRRIESHLNDEEQETFINYIAAHPTEGDLIEGTGGARKIRWAKPGRGKSGGIRVIYYHCNDDMPIFLLIVYGKNERSNLSKAERNASKVMIKQLVATYLEN